MNKEGYKKYLQTDHWQSLRKYWHSSYKRKSCLFCNSTKNLHIHHRFYRKNGQSVLYKEKIAYLITLCKDCHYLWHSIHGKTPITSLRTIEYIQNMLRLKIPLKEAIENCSKEDCIATIKRYKSQGTINDLSQMKLTQTNGGNPQIPDS